MKTLFQYLGAIALFQVAGLLLFAASQVYTQSSTCTFNKEYAYKAPNASAVYYITENCTKRAFPNAQIFFTYFDSWDRVEEAPASLLQKTPNDLLGFMPNGPLYDPQYGALVKTVNDPKVYLLLGTEKYWITSEAVFTALNYDWNWIEDVDARLLSKYTAGSEITDTARHPNFTIIKYRNDAKVYRLESDPADPKKQVKRHIADETAFRALRFRADRIVTVPDSETYADSAPLAEKDASVRAPSQEESGPSPAPQAQPACKSNPNPVFTHRLIDPSEVSNILPPPNRTRVGDVLKTHSYIDVPVVMTPLYAPVDMELIDGSHYVGGPYTLDFRVSCEVTIRLAHIHPVQKIKDVFPAEPAEGSATMQVNPPVVFQAGELVAYSGGPPHILNPGLDFGVYHSEKPNRYAAIPGIDQTPVYTTAVCPYEYFTDAIQSEYRAKFHLATHQGMRADGPSFCI